MTTPKSMTTEPVETNARGGQGSEMAEWPTAVPPGVALALARVFTYGAKKYALNNWHKVALTCVDGTGGHLDHALVHLYKFLDNPNEEDLTHALCRLSMACYLYFENPDDKGHKSPSASGASGTPVEATTSKHDPRPISVYYSASMRGEHGDKVTDEQLNANNNRGLKRSLAIQQELERVFKRPVRMYVPHKFEPAMRNAYRAGLMTAGEILDLDCEIISICDLIVADTPPGVSEGVDIEVAFATKRQIPVIHAYEVSDLSLRNAKNCKYGYFESILRSDKSTRQFVSD